LRNRRRRCRRRRRRHRRRRRRRRSIARGDSDTSCLYLSSHSSLSCERQCHASLTLTLTHRSAMTISDEHFGIIETAPL